MSKLQERIKRRRSESAEFARAFEDARREIAAANDFMKAVAAHLEELGMSKAELARLIDKNPSTVRKLFLDGANPTLATALEVASALDLEISVSPRRKLVDA